MDNLTIQILIITLTMLIALGIGLYLRFRLVRYLKKTVLDNWLIQIFGILIIVPPVIVGIIVLPLISGWTTPKMYDFWTKLASVLNISDPRNLIWNLVWSALIILLAIGVGRTLFKLLTGGVAKNHLGINIRLLLGRISYVLTMLIAFLWILFIWNLSFTVPATVISIITVGLAFVIQDLLKNLAAGLYILVEGPFHIGDLIFTENYTGKVVDVQLRATKLRIGTGEEVIIPNSMLFSGIVINKTTYDEKRAIIVITMHQEDYDKDQTHECILNTIKEVKYVMVKPEPELSVTGFAGSFGTSTGTVSGYTGKIITLTLKFWIPEGEDSIVTDAMLALRAALPNADLSITEPVGP
jgi:small-conductance mechanosensitive channel